jgi:hypothetical protein
MKNQSTSNMNRSLGRLRPKAKTKPRSPGSTGTIYIKRDLLLILTKQLEQSGEDEIAANIAGWVYDDGSGGQYMIIELSEKYKRAEPRDDGPFVGFH